MDTRELSPDRPMEVISLLQEAVASLDRMWHDALEGSSQPAVMALGEASHGVHRALIALRQSDQPL